MPTMNPSNGLKAAPLPQPVLAPLTSSAIFLVARIKPDAQFDFVVLVILTKEMEPREMWEATAPAVRTRLAEPGSKARNERGALSIRDFKKLPGCKRIWSADAAY